MARTGIRFRSIWTLALCLLAVDSLADAVFEPLMWMVGRRDLTPIEVVAGFAVDMTFFVVCFAAYWHLDLRHND